jgi:hypothetical protein
MDCLAPVGLPDPGGLGPGLRATARSCFGRRWRERWAIQTLADGILHRLMHNAQCIEALIDWAIVEPTGFANREPPTTSGFGHGSQSVSRSELIYCNLRNPIPKLARW